MRSEVGPVAFGELATANTKFVEAFRSDYQELIGNLNRDTKQVVSNFQSSVSGMRFDNTTRDYGYESPLDEIKEEILSFHYPSSW